MNEFKIFVDAQPKYLFSRPNENGECRRSWKDVYTGKRDIDTLETHIKPCLEAFEEHLFARNKEDRVLMAEIETEKLLFAYYETRNSMSELGITNEQKEIRRYLLLTLDKVVVCIICTVTRLKINYSIDYINEWKQRCEDWFPYEDLMTHEYTNTFRKNNKNSKSEKEQTFSIKLSEEKKKKLFDSLITNEYIDNDTLFENFSYIFSGQTIPTDFKPIKWIKMNSKTKVTPNKRSLFSLLSLLGVPFKEIVNKKMMNEFFIVNCGGKFKANNYTGINRSSDIKSECDNELIEITQKIFSS